MEAHCSIRRPRMELFYSDTIEESFSSTPLHDARQSSLP